MDKIDTEIRFAGMAEERLRREDPHYRVWSFTDDDDVTALYLGRVDMNGEPVERYDRTRTILAFDGGRVFAKWHGGRLFEGGRLADISPTMLKILGIKQPEEMTGESIIVD